MRTPLVLSAFALVVGGVLHLSGPAAAETFPTVPIPWYCHEADLIVEGRALKGDVLLVERVHKAPPKSVAVGGTITVLGLGQHDRVVDRHDRRNGGTPLQSDRVVLFLRSDAKTKHWMPMASGASPAKGLVGSGGMYWIGGGKVFVYSQRESPGPLYLTQATVPYSLAEVRRATERGLRNSKAFRAALATEDPSARARALAPYLLQSTSPVGPDNTFRFRVREPLGALGADALPALMKPLKHRAQTEDLREVIVILYDLGPVARPAVPLLTALLDKPSYRSNHTHAVAALGRIGDPAAIPALRRVFERGDLGIASEAAEALAALGDTDSFERIAARLPMDPVSDDVYRIAAMLEALQTLDVARARLHIERITAHPWMKEQPVRRRIESLLRPYRKR